MLFRRVLIVFCFFLPLAFAQSPSVSGPLREIRIQGATANEDLIRTLLVSRPGTPAETIDLEAERNLVYSLGYYDEVSVDLEDRGGGPVLIVRVVENPLIAEVEVNGATAADPELIENVLAEQHLLEPGRILNSVEVERSLGTIRSGYRQLNFPFDVSVDLATEPVAEEGEAQPGDNAAVRLVYTITETAPIREVVFEGNTVLDDEELEQIFAGLRSARSFDYRSYQTAVQEVSARYRELGYRDSGVDRNATELENGSLRVGLRELRVAGIDTTAIGVDPAELSLQPGDLYNYDALLGDIRRFSEGRDIDISLAEPLILSNGQVRLTLLAGAPETAGPIEDVEIEGNTVIPAEELLPLLSLEEGDTFTSALATEDYAAIAEYYAERGYLIAGSPNFSYLDGRYLQRVTEMKITAYEVIFESEAPKTDESVITRYLPEVGSIYNRDELTSGLNSLGRLGILEGVTPQPELTGEPGELRLNLLVREAATGRFGPEASYDTNQGFSANLSYSDSNFLGQAHTISANVTAQTSDIGFLLGGSAEYRIPWLYIDALDFKEVPTSLSGSLFSTVEANQSLTQDGQLKVCADPAERADDSCAPEERVFVGEYTRRDSGLSFSVGRRIFPNTNLRVSARGSYAAYFLEPERPCEFDDEGRPTNAETCTLPDSEALASLPQSGLAATVSSGLNFDNRDSADFPRRGVAASGSLGVGFGNDYRNPDTDEPQAYTYLPVEFGVSSYVALADLFPDEVSDPNHVFAFKVNLGHQFGGDYPADRYFRVGQTQADSTLIRGFDRSDFNPSRSYAIGTVEYRYDFGLSTVATQTVIGIVFADLGWASSVPGFGDYGGPLFLGAGVGVQVNLGFTALGFFPLRFDYGFSQRHPGGVLSFRIGSVF